MIDGKKVILSMGGGMESTSTLGLTLYDPRFQALRPDLVLFSDLGNEWKETYAHLEFVKGICQREGIEYAVITPEVHRGKKLFGENRQYTKLIDYLMDVKAVPGKAPNGKRLCTELFKVETIQDYLKERFEGQDLVVLIGFGSDEKSRIKRGENTVPGWTNRFLLDEADMCRCKSIEYMRSLGWPVPRRSGCTFCPFAKKMDFQVQAEVYPEDWKLTVALERNNRRFNDPEKPFFMVAANKPVDEWILTKDQKRERLCKGCGAEVDLALHVFGDTPLFKAYQDLKAKKLAEMQKKEQVTA